MSWKFDPAVSYYWLHIYNEDGSDYFNDSIGTVNSWSRKFPAGKYTIYLTACNTQDEKGATPFTITVKPLQAPVITGYKNEYGSNETFSMRWNSDPLVDRYWLHIYNEDGSDYFNDSIGAVNSWSRTLPTGGYTIYLTACSGDSQISAGAISVSVGPRAMPTLRADRTTLTTSDVTSFTFTKYGPSTTSGLGIFDSSGQQICYVDITNRSSFSYTFSAPGSYYAYISCYYDGRYYDSEKVNFMVFAPQFTCSKSAVYPQELLTFTYSGLTAAHQAVINFEKNGTVYYTSDTTSSRDFTTCFQNAGTYRVFVRAIYNSQAITTPAVTVRVAAKPTIRLDVAQPMTGGLTTFSYEKFAPSTNSWIGIFKSDGTQVALDSITEKSQYAYTFEEPGSYYANISCYCDGRYYDSDRVSFSVGGKAIPRIVIADAVLNGDTLTVHMTRDIALQCQAIAAFYQHGQMVMCHTLEANIAEGAFTMQVSGTATYDGYSVFLTDDDGIPLCACFNS